MLLSWLAFIWGVGMVHYFTHLLMDLKIRSLNPGSGEKSRGHITECHWFLLSSVYLSCFRRQKMKACGIFRDFLCFSFFWEREIIYYFKVNKLQIKKYYLLQLSSQSGLVFGQWLFSCCINGAWPARALDVPAVNIASCSRNWSFSKASASLCFRSSSITSLMHVFRQHSLQSWYYITTLVLYIVVWLCKVSELWAQRMER